jgi:elongation factor Ts
VAVSGTKGVAVEVNSETDFVAKNDQFQDFVRKTTEVALGLGSMMSSAEGGCLSGRRHRGRQADQQRRHHRREPAGPPDEDRLGLQGVVVPYMHNAAAPNLGKIGVLVALESEAGADVLEPLGKQIAMHIAAAFPLALDADDLDAEMIARERKIAAKRLPKAASPPKSRPRWSTAPSPSSPRTTPCSARSS